MRIMVVVSQAVTRHAVAAVSQRCSVSGKRASSSSSTSGTRSRKRRRADQVADPGDSLADAEAGVALEIGDRARFAARARRRAPANRASARPTRITQSSINTATWSDKPFLEAQPDQVAPGEFQELRRPGPDGQQAAAGSAADAADGEDRTPFLDPAQVAPAARRRAGLDWVKKTSTLPEDTHQTASGSSSASGRLAAVCSGRL